MGNCLIWLHIQKVNNIPFSLYICLEQHLSHSRLYTIFSLDLPIESIPPTPLFFSSPTIITPKPFFCQCSLPHIPSTSLPLAHCIYTLSHHEAKREISTALAPFRSFCSTCRSRFCVVQGYQTWLKHTTASMPSLSTLSAHFMLGVWLFGTLCVGKRLTSSRCKKRILTLGWIGPAFELLAPFSLSPHAAMWECLVFLRGGGALLITTQSHRAGTDNFSPRYPCGALGSVCTVLALGSINP